MVSHGFEILLLSSVNTDLMVLFFFFAVSFLHGSQQMTLPLLRLQQMAECPFGILLLELAKRSFGAIRNDILTLRQYSRYGFESRHCAHSGYYYCS